MLRHPSTRHEAFPSGDAASAAGDPTARNSRAISCISPALTIPAGLHSFTVPTSAAFSATLVLLGAGHGAWVFTVLSALGRMYFHAHHLLDVAVGSLVGALTVFAAAAALPVAHWGAAHAAGSVLVFVIAMRAMKKRKGDKK
jgi:hypothetical protein